MNAVLSARPTPPPTADVVRPPRPPLGVSLAFVAGLLAVAVAALTAVSEYASRTREQTATLLESVSHGHERSIVDYLAERRADAVIVARRPETRTILNTTLPAAVRERTRAEVLSYLVKVVTAYRYHNIQVVDAAGSSVLFTLHDEASNPQLRTTIARVLATGRPAVTPIVEDSRGVLEFGLIHPIFASDADSAVGRAPIGAVYLGLDAGDRLFSALRSTVAEAWSVEPTLLQRMGDSVWVFGAADSMVGTTVTARIALADTAYVPALAMRNPTQERHAGLDYRNVRVRAHAARVPGTEWIVVAKIDVAIAEARIWTVAFAAGAIFLFLVAVAAAIGRTLWLARRNEFQEIQARAGDRALRVVQTSLDGFIEMDDDGWVLEANDATARMSGYSRDELLRMRLSDLKVFGESDSLEQTLARIVTADGAQYTSVWRRKDGQLVDLDVSARHLTESGAGRTFAFVRDVTESLRTSKRLERANRVYRVLNAANEALFRSRSREEAYTSAVHAIVEEGGFALASIGDVDRGTGMLRPRAAEGAAVAYAESVRIDIAPGDDDARHPIMDAVERCERLAIGDLATNPLTAAWHAQASQHQLQSVAALPIVRRDRCVSLLLVYSTAADDFDDDALALLGEVARFLGVVLQTQDEAETRRLEEERFRALFESSPVAMFVVNESTGNILRVNRPFTALFGYTLRDLPTLDVMLARFYPDARYQREIRARLTADLAQLTADRTSVSADGLRARCADGTERVVQGSVSRVGGELVLGWIDMTELRRNQLLANEAQSIAKLMSWEFDFATRRMRFIDPLLQAEADKDPAGIGIFSRVLPEDRDRLRPLFYDAASRGEPTDFVARFQAPDGGIQYLRSRVRIELGADGTPSRAIGSSQDVTQETLLAQELDAHRSNLEELVRARTEELGRVNAQLLVNDRRLSAMLSLSRRASELDERALLQLGIDEAVRLTGSEIGYLHLISEDQSRIEFNTWSTSTGDLCRASYQEHYAVDKAGIWADAVRSKQAVVHNAVQDHHLRAGYPAGHVNLVRHLAVPLVEGNRVRLLMGIANKPTDYDDSDVQELELIARDVWGIVERRRTESKLAAAYAEVAASDARFALAMQASSEGIWDWDITRNHTLYSREYLNILGYAASEFSSDSAAFFSHLHPDDRERVMTTLFAGLKRDIPSSAEFRIRRKDGKYIWGVIRGQVMSRDAQGQATRAVGTFSDLSAQRAAEEELRAAKEAADAANRAKSAFLAVMSHEIRTPLNGVIGMAEVLSQSPLPTREADAVRTIRSSGANLMRIIDDILDFSKIEAGRLELDPTDTDLHALLDGVLSMLSPVAKAKGVELSVFVAPNVPHCIEIDEMRLRQILMNLVGNAIKFSGGRSGKSGNVQIRLELASEVPLRLRFSVRDNGIGISESQRARLFTSFQQAETSTTRRFGGTGLGLAICLRLAERFGGTIDVESTEGIGSTFHVTIPAIAAASQPKFELPDVAGLQCVVVRCGQPMCYADDLAEYLRHAGATAYVEDDEVRARRRVETLPDPVVMVDFAQPGDVLGGAIGDGDTVRHLRITHGHRRAARVVSPSLVVLDHQAVRERSFLHAVAIAAGRASPEVLTDQAEQPIIELGTQPISVAEARSRGQLILVAEDDEINQKVILRQLELLGHAAEVASNGIEALAMWRRGGYGLLITDLHMPEMDGYELAAAIRRLERDGLRAPIIALTANALRGEALRAREVGMDAYLTKPVPLKELRDVVQSAMAGVEERSAALSTAQGETGSSEFSTGEGPVVDVEVLKRYIGDDPEAITEFLIEFRKSVRHHAADLDKGVTARDVAQVSHSAHTLKSTARAAGATAFGDLLSEMEAAAKRHDLDAIDRYYEQFRHLLPVVIERLDVLVPPM